MISSFVQLQSKFVQSRLYLTGGWTGAVLVSSMGKRSKEHLKGMYTGFVVLHNKSVNTGTILYKILKIRVPKPRPKHGSLSLAELQFSDIHVKGECTVTNFYFDLGIFRFRSINDTDLYED